MGFNGPYGVYHSLYDSFHWMEKFGDPTFNYHTNLAKVWGLMAVRLSTMAKLPFEYKNYGQQIESFIADLEQNAKEKGLKLNLKDLQQAAINFRQAAIEYQDKIKDLDAKSKNLNTVNETLLKVERAFIDPKGLEKRPWYRHVIYAPGIYAGYAAEVFPSIKEAIDENDLARAQAAADQAKLALERAKTELLFHANP
ncbi:MAG: hypothetical protein IPK14_05640 [Blastocatellia bacterium]|nr:hypothetical protein [Blastocatellia bacterium]